jgi:hypothetical protein
VVALVVCAVVAFLVTGLALARRKPPYTGKHHTPTTAATTWGLSYTGSSTWSVTEDVTQADGRVNSYKESSSEQWHYSVSTENAQAATFSVTYPTPCHQFRSYPCPIVEAVGVGDGVATEGFKIDDVNSSGQSVNCSGDSTVKTGAEGAPLVQIEARYIKSEDAYKIGVVNLPLPAQLFSEVDPTCPPADTNGVTPLDVWDPPDLPSGSRYHANFWAVRQSIVIPARIFATFSQIDIPVSLSARDAPPGGCGISDTSITVCKVRGSWSGKLTLQRTT